MIVCVRFQSGLGCQSSPCCTLLAVEAEAHGKLDWWGKGITAEAKINHSKGLQRSAFQTRKLEPLDYRLTDLGIRLGSPRDKEPSSSGGVQPRENPFVSSLVSHAISILVNKTDTPNE